MRDLRNIERVDLQGSVDRRFDGLQMEQLDVRATGSSAGAFNGRVEELRVFASGSATIDARDLAASIVTVEASGSATVYVSASSQCVLEASGSARIHLHGEGEIVREVVSGSARVLRVGRMPC